MSQRQSGHFGEEIRLFTVSRIESYFSAFQVTVQLLYQPSYLT